MLKKIIVNIYYDAVSEDTQNIDDQMLATTWSQSPEWHDDDTILNHYNIALKVINFARNMSISDLAKAVGKSNAKLINAYGIPRRTMGNWSVKSCEPPHYVKLLIAESLGYLS